MRGKTDRIRSRICDVILGLLTKHHMKFDIIFIEDKTISDWETFIRSLAANVRECFQHSFSYIILKYHLVALLFVI